MSDLLILIPIFYIALLAIPLAITDVREHRLPNPMTLSAILVTLVSLCAAAFFPILLPSALSGLLAGGLTFALGLLLAKKDAIGMGDVKLLTSLNAIASYFSPLLMIISLTSGLVLATLVSSLLMLTKKVTLKQSLPLGPYLLIGFFVCVGPSAFLLTAEALS